MRRVAVFAFSVGVLATVYAAACVLPGEPSGAQRIAFQLDSTFPYRVPLAGTAEPTIGITAGGQHLSNPHYRLESFDGAVVRVDPTGRALEGMARGTTSVRVTYLGATGEPDTVFSVQVVVSRVVVDSPALAFTRLGARTRLSAIALDANNAAVPNVPFTWSSAQPMVAAVNDTGLVTAVDEGATTITAAADGVADTSDVTVTQLAAAVTVLPELDTLRTLGRSIQLFAVAFDSSNTVLSTVRPHWTSSDSTVARVDATGRATATGAGTSRIVARVGAAADTATLVVAQVVRVLAVSPGFDTLTAIADTARVVALALDSLNFPVPNPTVTWTTSDTAVATVDATGLVRATRNGVVLVTASAAGQSAFATIVVDQQVATARLSTHSVSLVGEGDTVRLSALGFDKNGYPVHTQANPLGLTPSVWHSGFGCVASLAGSEPELGGPSTLLTAQGAGQTFIIATPWTATGPGRPDTATVTVTGAPAAEAEIAYRSNWGIQAFCGVGGARTMLIWATTFFGRFADLWGPVWSPDGARLAFYGELYTSSGCGLYIARADGSGMQKISDRCGYSVGADRPAWSPDGTKLAFSPVNRNNSDQDTIYAVDADGSNLRPLFSFSPVRRVANPTWSPDGTQLAFDAAVFYPNAGDTNYIYVMNADGSGAHRLPNTAGGRAPTWSPDGSQLAFGRSDKPGQSDIWLISPDGSGATNLTQSNAAFAMTPAWSPDGSRLVFEGQIPGSNGGHLFVINRDATGSQQLETGDDAVPVSSPTWRRRP